MCVHRQIDRLTVLPYGVSGHTRVTPSILGLCPKRKKNTSILIRSIERLNNSMARFPDLSVFYHQFPGRQDRVSACRVRQSDAVFLPARDGLRHSFSRTGQQRPCILHHPQLRCSSADGGRDWEGNVEYVSSFILLYHFILSFS